MEHSSHMLTIRAGSASTSKRPSAASATAACITDGPRENPAMPPAKGGICEHGDGWQGGRSRRSLPRCPSYSWLSWRWPTRPADRGRGRRRAGAVAFDKPVRILLAGQAGGRASANAGAAEAIDGRCAADDARRVHVQLGGGGGGRQGDLHVPPDAVHHRPVRARYAAARQTLMLGAPRLARPGVRAGAGAYSDAVRQGGAAVVCAESYRIRQRGRRRARLVRHVRGRVRRAGRRRPAAAGGLRLHGASNMAGSGAPHPRCGTAAPAHSTCPGMAPNPAGDL